MKTSALCLLLASLLGAASVIAETPAKLGLCVACHGNNGVSVSGEWPNLAGQKAGYLSVQMQAFRDGTRRNDAMAPFVKQLSDEDIAELAAYYAAQPMAVAADGDRALVDAGHNAAAYCMSCHGGNGVSANEEWPNLAGQHAAYLEKQLHAFHSGERDNGLMWNILKDKDAASFAALAAYFSQLKP